MIFKFAYTNAVTADKKVLQWCKIQSPLSKSSYRLAGVFFTGAKRCDYSMQMRRYPVWNDFGAEVRPLNKKAFSIPTENTDNRQKDI